MSTRRRVVNQVGPRAHRVVVQRRLNRQQLTVPPLLTMLSNRRIILMRTNGLARILRDGQIDILLNEWQNSCVSNLRPEI